MKQLVSAVVLAALMAASPALTAQAQQPAAARPTVAIIDLSYIFKNYSKFNEMTANIKRQVEGADAQLKGKQEELKKVAQQVEGLPLGSPERNQLEEQATKMQADIQVEVATQRKDFLRQEAAIYYNIYQEVQDAIKSYCERNGILLVMRFNGDQPDANNPQEVMQDLNKAVVYYNRSIDITFPIKEMLEANRPQAGARPAATQPGVRPQTARPTAPRTK